MPQFDKIEQDVLEALAAGLPMPFLVLDHFGHIRVATLSAKSIFNIHGEDVAFFDLFESSEHEKIQSTFLTQTNLNFSKSVYLQLTLSTKDVIKGEFNISPYRSPAGEYYVLVTVYNTATDLAGGKSVRLTVNDDELEILSGDVKLAELVKDVKSSYPFTFLSKNRVAQKINQYDGALWIKNETGNYILVNERFATSFMMKPSGIEGKSEMNFLPLYMQTFHSSIQKHIEQTHNVVTLEGSVLLGSKSTEGLQTVLLPLIDATGNFRGIIGFTKKKHLQAVANSNKRPESALAEIINDLPLAAGIFDNSGKLVLHNQLYRSVFSGTRPIETIEALGYTKEIEQLKSAQGNTILEIEFYTNGYDSRKARLIKTSYVDGLLFILEDKNEITLENLLKHRGKMHEQLFKYNPEPIVTYYKDSFKFIDCNQKSIELYGYSLDEFMMMDFTDLYSPSDLQELRSGFDVDEGKFSAPQLHRRKDGSYVNVSLFRIPFMYEGKKAHYCLIKDMSSDKNVRINEMLYNDLFENSDLPLLVLDDIRFIKKINNKAYEMFGKPKGSLLEEAFYSLIDDKSRVEFSGVTNKHKPVQTKTVIRVTTPEGFISKTFTIVPIVPDGKSAEYYLLIGEPASGEVVVKEVIKEIIKEKPVEKIVTVEKPVEKIVYRDNPSSGPVTQINGINSSQIGYIFHELNTPMNAILGFVDLVKSSLPELDEEQIESFQIIDQNKSKFKLTVNSVGEYARVIEDLRNLSVSTSSFSSIFESMLRDHETPDPLFWREVVAGRISGFAIDTDTEKMKSFLKTIIMMAFLSNDSEKVIVSSSQIDEHNFMISIKDGNEKVSDKTLQAIQSVFNGADIYVLRSIGFSRFNVYTVQKLLKALQGRFETKMVSGRPSELGFVFPIKLDASSYNPEVESDDFGHALQSSRVPKSIMPPTAVNAVEEKVTEPTSFTNTPVSQSENAFDSFSRYSFTNSFTSDAATEKTNTEIPAKEIKETVKPQAEPKPMFSDAPVQSQPISRENNLVTSNTDDSSINLGDLTCLYVEDSVDAQILFRQQCKEMRLIKFAASFEEAMPLFQEFSFDYILLDINLQGEYNGLDALKMIRQIPGYSNKPIIGASAYVLPGDREKFISAGFSAFIEKPVYKTTLIEKLSKLKK